jgi:hypothetical protein
VYLERLRIAHHGPFDDLECNFLDPTGAPRLLTVVHGDGGTGKSTLIEAVAHTRPGKATPLSPHKRHGVEEAYAICEWRLGLEDPDRPHPLRVCSPNLRATSNANGNGDVGAWREQSYFDRCAAQGPGFVFVDIPSQRYFSRTSLGLTDPARTVARYDPRNPGATADANRPDLTRPCKQAMSYAAISMALSDTQNAAWQNTHVLGQAMHAAVDEVAELGSYRYTGPDAHTLEPMFETPGGGRLSFDELPTQLRHAIAFLVIPIQMTWAGHGGVDPRMTECVVAIDDFELYLAPPVLSGVLAIMRRVLPRAQWILTTGSPHAAAAVHADTLLTLRRAPMSDEVALYSGDLAITH